MVSDIMSKKDEGWVKLWRRFMKHPINQSKDPAMTKLAVNLLLMANHGENDLMLDNGDMIHLMPGQLWTSQESLEKRVKLSRQKIRTILKNLKKCEFLTTESTKQGTMISIINWHIWQGDETDNNQHINPSLTNGQPTLNQEQECKECKNDKYNMERVSKKRTQPKPEKKTNPDIKIFMDWYFQKHLELTNSKLIIDGAKEGNIVKALLGTLTLDELKVRAVKFLNDPSSWPDPSDKSIAKLKMNVNKYIEKTPGKNDSRGGRNDADYGM